MIEKFNLWTKNLIIAVAITTIIEMLVPEGSNKKYIKIVCSIYILFIILNPIVSFTKSDINNLKIDNQTIQTSNINNESIANVYIEAYENEIKNQLLNEGYDLHDININLDDSYENIESIEIKLNYISDTEKEKLIDTVKQLYSIENIIIK